MNKKQLEEVRNEIGDKLVEGYGDVKEEDIEQFEDLVDIEFQEYLRSRRWNDFEKKKCLKELIEIELKENQELIRNNNRVEIGTSSKKYREELDPYGTHILKMRREAREARKARFSIVEKSKSDKIEDFRFKRKMKKIVKEIKREIIEID